MCFEFDTKTPKFLIALKRFSALFHTLYNNLNAEPGVSIHLEDEFGSIRLRIVKEN